MDELILQFLHDNVTPEQYQLYLDLMDTLEQMGNDEIQTVVLNHINTVEDVGIQQTIDNIFNLLDGSLIQTIITFGVYLDATQTTFSWRCELLQDLIDLENLDDVEDALNILNGEDSAESILADVLEYTTGNDSTEYLIAFNRVSPSTIANLKEIYQRTYLNAPVEEEEEDPDVNKLKNEKRALLKLYREYTHDELGFATQLIAVDIPFLMPFKKYLEMIEPMKVEKQLSVNYFKAIIVFAIMCNEKDSLFNIVRSHMEDLDEDPITAIQYEAQIRKMLNEFKVYANQRGSMVI